MARPRSEDKRNSILDAAVRVFAERGLSAPTSAISTAAGLAEGTLFTYFQTKDELLNALYREIKLDLAGAMMSAYPRRKSVRERFRHVWNRYVEWGVANPLHRQVLRSLEVWAGLTEESKTAGMTPFLEIQSTAGSAVAQRIIRPLPQEFIAAFMQSLAQTTMDFISRLPDQADFYRDTGFELLWAGITRPR